MTCGRWMSRKGSPNMDRRFSARTLCRIAVLGITACGSPARLPVEQGIGPRPMLPPPEHALIPTVKIAPAKGWAAGERPTVADGLVVTAFATGLDHPRWLHVL